MDKKVRTKKKTLKSDKASRKTRSGPRGRKQNKEIILPWTKLFPIIAIGASAGGLEAFTQLLGKLPVNTGMAFVFVQHLAPLHESLLTDLLAKATKMPVREVIDGMRVEPDHAYVIPPKTSMAILNGVLHLMPREVTRGQHLTIDFFLHSLADDQGDNAIAVILSGTGSDGASGVRAIKTEGGVVFAQDEKTAKYSSMPQSAVATGCVDFVMPPEMIAKELLRISRHPYMVLTEAKETEPVLFEKKEDDLSSIFILLRTATGVDFTGYKCSTIKRRIMRRLLLLRIEKLENYLKHLHENPYELEALYQDILINVTRFFRDSETFNALRSAVFPNIIKKPLSDIPIRIWVPGCSTGEEAYSIAICLLEFLDERRAVQPIQIFATDVDETAIEKARKGVYPESITTDISTERLRRFFVKTEKGFQISKSIREICIFARHNLIKDPPFSRMDFVCCRNLLIYFGLSLQKKAISRFHYALNPGGFLMLGTSETTGEFSSFFSKVDKKQKIYSRKAGLTRPDFDISAVEYATEKRIGLKKPEVLPIREIKAHKKAELPPIAETEKKPKKKSSALKGRSGDKDFVRMRHELAATREQLKSVISAHEASNEELQALNEEMQSSNEELQSVNEELETSQEELQSTNEELVTVNDELLNRNDELTETSNDLINILRGVQIPVILLGNELQIRRFNDTAAKLLNLIPTDIGRSFSNIRTNISLPDLDVLIFDVINTLHTKELDIQDLKGNWYSMIIRPYKTLDNRIEGALISMVDINEIKLNSIRLKESGDYAEAIVATVREPLIILNEDLRVMSANKAFYHTFQTKQEEAENSSIFGLADGRWNILSLRKLLEAVLTSGRAFEDFRVDLELPNTGPKTVLLNARRIYRGEINPTLILLAIEDITERNEIEKTLRRVRNELEIRVDERTSELTELNEELLGEKRQIKIINRLLELFVENAFRKEFLDYAVKIIQEWCNCRCLGIRVLDEKGNIPYESSIGFSQEFLESESHLSVDTDKCSCIRVITGNTEPQDLTSMTKYGSFYSNNTFEFVDGLTDEEKSRFRGVCVRNSFKSVAIIPVFYHDKIFGAIHLADEKEDMVRLNKVEFIETLSLIIGEAIYKFNAEEELRRSQEQLRNLTAHLQEVREEERTTIAREIHDELGQIMTALKIDLSWLKNNYSDHEALSKKTQSMMSLLDETIQTVRRIITELRPGILDHLGISAAMEWQTEEFKKLAGIQCNVVITPEEIILGKDLSINMFRIFQEILTNIARHSQASSVNVLLEQNDGAVTLKVEDNGKGITEEEILKPASFGIMGMRERVNYMGGSLKINGIPQKGTLIEVVVPIESKPQ